MRGTAARSFFIDSLLVRIHFIIVMIRWTGLAAWQVQVKMEEARHSGEKLKAWKLPHITVRHMPLSQHVNLDV